MGQLDNEDNREIVEDEGNGFFDPELEGILRATAEIPVTDNVTKVENIGIKQPQDKPIKLNNQQRIEVQSGSKVENTIREILSRKSKISLKSSINLQVYDKKTFKFLLDLFEKDLKQEEIIDIIIKGLDMEEIKNSIKNTLIAHYNKPIK